MEWFAEHQLELLQSGKEVGKNKVWTRVVSLLKEKPEGIRPTDVYRRRIRPHAEAAKALLDRLVEAKRLVVEESKPPGGGRITRIYKLPK